MNIRGTAPGGAAVDADGCAESQLDDDGDGVTNDLDLCPGTPGGTMVDEDGCPIGDPDTDGDGVSDGADLCPATVIPEAVPTKFLRKNRYALTTQNSMTFESTNKTVFTTVDTGGCSCQQIIARLGLGRGQTAFGCSKSVMLEQIDQVGP